jgi:hypothetical protein
MAKAAAAREPHRQNESADSDPLADYFRQSPNSVTGGI